MPILKSIKFNTIFWKIFLSFWLAMILIVAATTVTVGLVMDRDHIKVRRQMIEKHQASTALTLFETGGPRALQRWLQEHHHRYAKSTFLVNEQHRDVLGRRLPPWVAKQLRSGGERLELPMGRGRGLLLPVLASDGKQYWYVRMAPHPRSSNRSWKRHEGPPAIRGIVFILALIVTGLISYWLARNITSPIRQLQRATQQISGGELSARVESSVAQRKDEFGGLGRDFDRMAEQIEELVAAQKRMLRDVSHELRSPLARLQVALELARKAVAGKADPEHDRIEKEANRLDELIGQVLSLVRLTTHGRQLDRENLDILPLLEQIAGDAGFETEAQHKEVKFISCYSFSVDANAELLYSALENVIRNAIRYTPENSKIEISMAPYDSKGLCVRVRDYGPGVSEQGLAHLFEPFYREAEARDRSSGGYGLGLAIAQRAIMLHDGKITAANASGGGLLIEIWLPGK